MDELAAQTGRRYGLVDYHGAPDADRVIVIMGSGAGAVEETVDALNAAGEKVGVLAGPALPAVPGRRRSSPPSRRPSSSIAVLDRTKEPGAVGEPLYQALVAAVAERMESDAPPFAAMPRDHRRPLRPLVEGSDAGHATPGLRRARRARGPSATSRSGIYDDVTHLSLPIDVDFRAPRPKRRGAGPLLRPGLRRHGRGEPGLGQDHRRRHRSLRPGLLRLRLEEVGRHDRLAPALRAACRPGRRT